MKEPERLLSGGSALERSLLSASNDEVPSADLEKRILAAMAAAPLAAGAASSAASSSTIARWLSSSTAKIGLATVVVGAVIVGAMLRREPASVSTSAPQTATAAPVEAPAPTTTPTQAVVVMTPNALPNAPAPAKATSARAATSAPAPVPTTVASASIAREIELLDAVKTKLGAGSAADAARALDAYDSEFPQGAGTLRPEATVLRIRTLLLTGDRAGAEKLGTEFLARHPNGVHAKRVRALLEEK